MLTKRGYAVRALRKFQLRSVNAKQGRFSKLVCRSLAPEETINGLGSWIRKQKETRTLEKLAFGPTQSKVLLKNHTAFKLKIGKINEEKEAGRYAFLPYYDLHVFARYFLQKFMLYVAPYYGNQRLKYCYVDRVGKIISPTQMSWGLPFGGVIVQVPDGASFPFEIEFKYTDFDSSYYLQREDFKIFEDDFENLDNWNLSDDADVEVSGSKVKINQGYIEHKSLYFDVHQIRKGWYLRLVGAKGGTDITVVSIGFSDYWFLNVACVGDTTTSAFFSSDIRSLSWDCRDFVRLGDYNGGAFVEPWQIIFYVPKNPYRSYRVVYQWLLAQFHRLFDEFHFPVEPFSFITNAYLALSRRPDTCLIMEREAINMNCPSVEGFLKIKEVRGEFFELDKIEVYEIPGENLEIVSSSFEFEDSVYESMPIHLGELDVMPFKTELINVKGQAPEYPSEEGVEKWLKPIKPKLKEERASVRWFNPFVLSLPLKEECRKLTGVEGVEIEIKGRESLEQTVFLEPGRFYSFIFEAVELSPVSITKNFKVNGNRLEGWYIEDEPITLVVSDENGCQHTLHLIPKRFYNLIEY